MTAFKFIENKNFECHTEKIQQNQSAFCINTTSEYELKILLAEDDLINQKVTLKLLEKMAYTADVAINGIQVLQYLEKDLYDLILMDIRMPEMDGLEATMAINDIYGKKRPVIIALTADVFEGAKEKYLKAGLDDYMAKPVTFEIFQNMIIKWAKKVNHKRKKFIFK